MCTPKFRLVIEIICPSFSQSRIKYSIELANSVFVSEAFQGAKALSLNCFSSFVSSPEEFFTGMIYWFEMVPQSLIMCLLFWFGYDFHQELHVYHIDPGENSGHHTSKRLCNSNDSELEWRMLMSSAYYACTVWIAVWNASWLKL